MKRLILTFTIMVMALGAQQATSASYSNWGLNLGLNVGGGTGYSNSGYGGGYYGGQIMGGAGFNSLQGIGRACYPGGGYPHQGGVVNRPFPGLPQGGHAGRYPTPYPTNRGGIRYPGQVYPQGQYVRNPCIPCGGSIYGQGFGQMSGLYGYGQGGIYGGRGIAAAGGLQTGFGGGIQVNYGNQSLGGNGALIGALGMGLSYQTTNVTPYYVPRINNTVIRNQPTPVPFGPNRSGNHTNR